MRGDPLRVRARHWARWRQRRVADTWRHRAHLDALGSDARAVWLCSWQRSGSTWLAELLASAPGTRLVYEPANLPGRLFTGEEAALAPMATGPGPELDAVERALRGHVHGAWVDQLAIGHVAHRRVVKDVRAIGLLDLVAARHPATPLVVLVRHPLSIATSVVELGWTARRGDPREDQLLAEVDRWAAMHADALRAPASARALVVTYEHLVMDPDATLAVVLALLGRHHATWRGLHVDRARLATPSATSFRRGGARTPAEWIGSFDDLPGRVVQESSAILAAAGLDWLYGSAPTPLVEAVGLDAALRATR